MTRSRLVLVRFFFCFDFSFLSRGNSVIDLSFVIAGSTAFKYDVLSFKNDRLGPDEQ